MIYCWLPVSSHWAFVWTIVNCLDANISVNNETRVALLNSNQRQFLKWKQIMFICLITTSASTSCRPLSPLSSLEGHCSEWKCICSLVSCQFGTLKRSYISSCDSLKVIDYPILITLKFLIRLKHSFKRFKLLIQSYVEFKKENENETWALASIFIKLHQLLFVMR